MLFRHGFLIHMIKQIPTYQNHLEAIFDASTSSILLVDQMGAIQNHNFATEKIFGYESSEFGKLSIDRLLPQVCSKTEGKNKVVSMIDPAFLDGKPHETTALRKSDTEFPAEISVRLVNIDGKYLHIVTVLDISKYKNAETELKSRQKCMELILETAQAALMIIDEQGTIDSQSRSVNEIFNYGTVELAKLRIYDLVTSVFSKEMDEHGNVSVMLDPLFLDGETHETTAIRKNKEQFPVTVMVKMAELEGKPIHIVRMRDITSRKKMESELKSRRQRLELLQDVTKAALISTNKQGVMEIRSRASEVFSYEDAELAELRIYDLVPSVFSKAVDEQGNVSAILDPLFRDEKKHETFALRKNKEEFLATIMVRKAELDGKPIHIVRVYDITQRKGMENELRSRQQRLEVILQNAAEGILTFDEVGIIESVNNAAEKLFGCPAQDMVGHPISLLIPPDVQERHEEELQHLMQVKTDQLVGLEGEVIGQCQNGAKFPMAIKISVMELEGKKLYTALVEDISERKAFVENLKYMAEHDGLTGLYNRRYFHGEWERLVARAKRPGSQACALLYIDLDNLKYVNDIIGHSAGDQVLIEVAAILNKRARKSDLIARLGGDEFAVLLYNTNAKRTKQVAESFREKIADYSFRQGTEVVDVGCSIGVVMVSSTSKSAEETLSQADMACRLAKREGRNRVHVFELEDESNLVNMSLDMGWARRIREAVKHDRFVLAYQPIVNTQTGVVDAFEVLIRMLDDKDELILPFGFLPSAERFGLAVDIDKWVITHAIETLVEQRKVLPGLRFAINLSGQTFSDPSVADLILMTLHATGLDPVALIFEVTETVAIADLTRAQSFLSKLQEIGCETALDDFGSGFSSFAYLRDLPVGCVKIDGHFVKNLAKSSVDQAMVKGMNDIVHALGKKTVAEFVEDEESLQLLKEYGVDYAQGYHLGKPDILLPCNVGVGHAEQPVLRKRSKK